MRVVTLLDNVSAGVTIISEYINFDQRTSWKLFIESTGLDGTPKLFIEESSTKDKCIEPTGGWTNYNQCCSIDGFDIDEDLIVIEKNDFKSNWFRIRLEAEDNTTGTLTAKISYKTYP